ncbi:MAG: FRG domain-containing protein [Candidatus Firestonebacteria bacterium]|nr:FRG domain-containing protein [Candidatus Firestonebacteria bacterium]
MNEIIPKNWSQLQTILFDYEWDLTAPGCHRSPYAYRGLSENYSDLKTGLMRIGGNYKELESAILRNFQKYAKGNNIDNDSEWLWISIAQHHGLPTRLTDWTYSQYIALHFATENIDKINKDGVIWCIDYMKVKEFLPERLKNILKNQGFKFNVELLEKNVKNLSELENLEKEHGEPFIVFLEPPSLDSRIINQYALFSFMSSADTLLSHWLKKYSDVYKKIIIPAHLKWEIRDNLDQANINERILFPGLDGLCSWLKRYYSSRKPDKS